MTDAPKPHTYYETARTWENHHRNIHSTPQRCYDVWNLWEDGSPPECEVWRAGLSAICRIVCDAEATRDSSNGNRASREVRGLGSGWSLSSAAVTAGFLLNTAPLNHIEAGFHGASCDPACRAAPEHLVFAQCGATVMELNHALESRGLALPTSGATNGQTIVGAISTGTHGSAPGVGAMQDFMLGLHVVAEHGNHFWIERASRPTVSREFCARLGATLLRDDALFDAAVVSFGNFGIIHAVVFAAVPLYVLAADALRYDYQEILPVIATLDIERLGLRRAAHAPPLPYHFQVTVNPYATGRGKRGAFVRYMDQRHDLGPREVAETGSRISSQAMQMVGYLSDVVPLRIPQALQIALDVEMGVGRPTVATPGNTFAATALPGPSLSTEMAFALRDAPAALQIMVDEFNSYPFAAVPSLRFVRATEALLGFTKFEPVTCTIELQGAAAARTWVGYRRIWSALERHHIPHTFHWGQCQNPSPASLRAVFGPRVDAWLAARRSFLSTPARRMFSNIMLEQWGLADNAPPQQFH